jgi:hypothetical protein
MTTNDLLIPAVVIIIAMSLFIGNLAPGHMETEIGGELPEPSIWDVIYFTGGAFVGLLTFSVTGLPMAFSYITWFLLFIVVWCIMRLVRGVP